MKKHYVWLSCVITITCDPNTQHRCISASGAAARNKACALRRQFGTGKKYDMAAIEQEYNAEYQKKHQVIHDKLKN